MPKEVKIKTLFLENKEKYLAIIFFTHQFADKKEWFREYDFRYALEKNNNLSFSYRNALEKFYGNELKDEYENPLSPIKKYFNSRRNLIDHINNLCKLDLLNKKIINGKKHYQFARKKRNELFHAYNYAWFRLLSEKVPPEFLRRIKEDLISKYGKELRKYDAFFIRYQI